MATTTRSFTSILAFTLLLSLTNATRYYDPCVKAFDRCKFTFAGARGLQTFRIPFIPDRAFTSDIVLKDRRKFIGVVNSNIEGEFINRDGSVVPFTHDIPRRSGVQPFTPSVFKPFFPSKHGKYSGIGHETFQKGQLEFAKGRCVRVFITEFQVLSRRYGNVVENKNGLTNKRDNFCIVFRTAEHRRREKKEREE